MTEAAAAAAIAAILVLLKLVMPFLVAVTMMASAVPTPDAKSEAIPL